MICPVRPRRARIMSAKRRMSRKDAGSLLDATCILDREMEPAVLHIVEHHIPLHQQRQQCRANAAHRVKDGVAGRGVAIHEPLHEVQVEFGRVRPTVGHEQAAAQRAVGAELQQGWRRSAAYGRHSGSTRCIPSVAADARRVGLMVAAAHGR